MGTKKEHWGGPIKKSLQGRGSEKFCRSGWSESLWYALLQGGSASSNLAKIRRKEGREGWSLYQNMPATLKGVIHLRNRARDIIFLLRGNQ